MEDNDGFHIVRVIERQQAGYVSFAEAQKEIAEKIREERKLAALTEFLDDLRARTHVWTIFD